MDHITMQQLDGLDALFALNERQHAGDTPKY